MNKSAARIFHKRNLFVLGLLLLITCFLLYLFEYKVLIPSEQDIVKGDSFKWTSTLSDNNFSFAYRISEYDSQKAMMHIYENQVIARIYDSELLLEDILIERENVCVNLKIKNSMGFISGKILTTGRYGNSSSSFQNPKVVVSVNGIEVPAGIEFEINKIKLTFHREDFFKNGDLHFNISGLYILEYSRKIF